MKIIKKKTVAFVGSSNLTASKSISDRNLENVIRTEVFYVIEELHKEGKDTFLMEAKSGFEILAAEAVLEYAKSHDGIGLYVVTLSGMSDREDMRVCYKRVFEAITGRLVINEEGIDDFLIRNSSEVVIYGSDEEPEVISVLNKAERNGVEAWNIYDELEGYFSIQSPVKEFLQNYPEIGSFRYGREGVIFRGYNQPFPVAFTAITRVERKNNRLYFTLIDGMVILASLLTDDCYVRVPPVDSSDSKNLC